MKHSLYADCLGSSNCPHWIFSRSSTRNMCCLRMGIVTASITSSTQLTIISASSSSFIPNSECSLALYKYPGRGCYDPLSVGVVVPGSQTTLKSNPPNLDLCFAT